MQQMHHELPTWRTCSVNTFSLHRPVRPWLCTLMRHHSSLESQAPLPATHMFPLTSFPAPTLSSARVNRWVQARTFLRGCVGHGFDAKQVLGFLSSSLNFFLSWAWKTSRRAALELYWRLGLMERRVPSLYGMLKMSECSLNNKFVHWI